MPMDPDIQVLVQFAAEMRQRNRLPEDTWIAVAPPGDPVVWGKLRMNEQYLWTQRIQVTWEEEIVHE